MFRFWEEKIKAFPNEPKTMFLPLLIYFDEFEPLNVLGSKSGLYKIGAIHVRLIYLPPEINSKVKSIQPAMLFFTEDRKSISDAKIFSPLIQEVNFLSQTGVEIILNGDFQIESAKCECPRGKVICHHIAATLFAAHYDISKTDVSCSWVPTPIDQSDVKTIDEIFGIEKPLRLTDRNLDETELNELFQSLLEIPPVGFRWILRSHFEGDDDDENADDANAILDSIDIKYILQSKEAIQAPDKIEFLKEKFKVTCNVIQNVMKLTIGQAQIVNWHIVRKNRITASNFGKVIGSINRNRYPPSLFSTLLSNKDLRKVRAIQWGITHENDGLKALSGIIKQEIKTCGIFLSASGVLGATPDGVIDEDYVVEIKCPFKFRNCKLTDALKK